MNPTLAALYGTGIEKTASEGEEELDLHSISAADFLAAIEESEKVAGEEDFDLSDLSDEELVALYNEMESEDTIEKMASSGELEYWDMAGRVMAHAYADEIDKTASAYDEEDFDLNEFSVEELIELGQELEKEAAYLPGRGQARALGRATAEGFRGGMPAFLRSGELRGAARTQMGRAKRKAMEAYGRGAAAVDRGVTGAAKATMARAQRGTAMDSLGRRVRARLPKSIKAKTTNMTNTELGTMVAAATGMGATAALSGGVAGAISSRRN